MVDEVKPEDRRREMDKIAKGIVDAFSGQMSRQELIDFGVEIIRQVLVQNDASRDMKVMSVAHYAHAVLEVPNFTDSNHNTMGCRVCRAIVLNLGDAL